MNKRLRKYLKMIPLLTDLKIKYNRAASIASGRVPATEDEAEKILAEFRVIAEELGKVTKRGLMK